MIIRLETPADIPAIHGLNEIAFGQPLEANIVDTIRRSNGVGLSLVADNQGRIVGHILFSPAVIEGPKGSITGMGLAPLAVLPELQRKGIGTQLVKRGIEDLITIRYPFIMVLGHADYYPRFGFERASRYGIRCPWDGVPDEVFMVLWLDRSKAGAFPGIARYRDEFDEAI
jgi:putative acetyltransferase